MTALGDFSAGDVLTAADMNAIGTWQTWTPSLSAFTGTTDYARYARINKWVICEAQFTIATVTSSAFSVTYPVTPAAGNFEWGRITGPGSYAYDLSAGAASAVYVTRNGSYFQFANSNVSALLRNTVPFTWAAGDVLIMRAIYEAA